ncbi:MAG: hypothetical protein I3270_02175 [Candidatus Moeniiplasma glomeromycotorum]|nr:hypothetical protein [Candidatus Moeniiplasma glomeromycotorum]MCE8162503.1 hypothetical protein [Candidatus Moeniiplasma glomeromycotorum]MCE8166430.1 hypothetical protein [Candidatus Moeniiplasma glomeromycotorum]MCE8166915.1 hypothetical protein [Candidatus Moeniiplasma glomeromycotorum]
MQVKCYDCGRLVSSGEAVKQNERDGRAGGGGYGKHGWGVGTGSWKSAGKSYWLCIECDRRRAENRRFWQWVIIGVFLGVLLLILIIGLTIGKNN